MLDSRAALSQKYNVRYSISHIYNFKSLVATLKDKRKWVYDIKNIFYLTKYIQKYYLNKIK